MFAVADYQIVVHTLSDGAEVHVLLRPGEDPKVPALQVCRAADSFKRKDGEFSTSDMLQRLDRQHATVVADPDRIYTRRRREATLVSFDGLAEKAARVKRVPGYLAFWARFLYEVILPEYPGYTREYAAEVEAWKARTMPLVPPAPVDAEEVLVLMDEDRRDVMGWSTHSGDPWGNWVRYRAPVTDIALVSRFLPAHARLVVYLADWIAARGGPVMEPVWARQEGGRITLPGGTPVVRGVAPHESPREATQEVVEPARAVGADHLPMLVPFHDDQIEFLYDTRNGKEWAVLRRLCENMGVDYSSQLQRLKELVEEEGWPTVVQCTTVAADEARREMVVIDRRTLYMWLAQIDLKKVGKPEVAEKIRLYKCEVAAVIEAHFGGKGGPGLTVEAFRGIVKEVVLEVLTGHREQVEQRLLQFCEAISETYRQLAADVGELKDVASDAAQGAVELVRKVGERWMILRHWLEERGRRPRDGSNEQALGRQMINWARTTGKYQPRRASDVKGDVWSHPEWALDEFLPSVTVPDLKVKPQEPPLAEEA